MPEYNVDKKKLECLFCWAQLYQNSPSLTYPVFPNDRKFLKVQEEIKRVQKEMFTIK